MSDEVAKQREEARADVKSLSDDELVRELAEIGRREFLRGTGGTRGTGGALPTASSEGAALLPLAIGVVALALAIAKRALEEPQSAEHIERVGWGEALLLGAGGLIDFCPESLPSHAVLATRVGAPKPKKHHRPRRVRAAG